MAGQHRSDPARAPSRDGVVRAAGKIAGILAPTPLLPLIVAGTRIWCKAESLQPVGAFKIRGAWHRLTDLDAAERERGVVAFSSGNHAQGVAWAAHRLGIPATIVMPHDAPLAKRNATAALGARIHGYDRSSESREAIAAALASETGAVLVPSFDDPWIIEGQGSAGIEAAAQMDALAGGEPDLVVACCGGGGLAAGLALALPGAAIVTAEPEGWDDMAQSLAAGTVVPVREPAPPTASDALMTLRVAESTLAVLRGRSAVGVAVSEAEVRDAQRLAFERLRLVIEPGGAVALAAVLSGHVEPGERTLVTLSGGNVDAEDFAAMLAATVPIAR